MQQHKVKIIFAAVCVVLLGLGLSLHLFNNAKPKNWLDGQVSLKGGELTKPIQAYEYAKRLNFTFVEDTKKRDRLIKNETLVPLEGTYIKLADVSQPYLLPITLQFVTRLSQQYAAQGCGKLTVTSALRLTMDQPSNASPHSVHPTGMAVDFRIPEHPFCNTWIRRTLLNIEADQRVDSTKEAGPPHLHAVVVTESYKQ